MAVNVAYRLKQSKTKQNTHQLNIKPFQASGFSSKIWNNKPAS